MDTDEEVQIQFTTNPKTVKCDACGARIDYDTAHNNVKNSASKIYAEE